MNGTNLPAIACRFLLISLHIDAILGEVTIRQRRKKLEEMTQGNGLGDAYTATLTRLKAQKGNKSVLGIKVLMWVLYSERPLRAEELCHALGVELGSVDLDLENVPTLRTILASSLGLVNVEASSSTVRLVHFTLQEHLLSRPTLFHSPRSAIAEVCLTYLNFQCVRDLSPTLYLAPLTLPLLEYASCYWGKHAEHGMTENVKVLALRLLSGFDKHVSAQLMLLDYNKSKGHEIRLSLGGGPRGFTGLHGAAFLGIVWLAAAVLEMKRWDVNATDSIRSKVSRYSSRIIRKSFTSTIKTIRYGTTECISSNIEIIYGRTPLLWAAERGHEGVVRILLGREDVNLNQASTGWTPLLLAADGGHEGVVKLLLERASVNPSQADTEYGQTPLSLAAQKGHGGIVKMLLDREGVDHYQADSKYGRTPLLWAAMFGNEAVVKMLLDREGVNPGQADKQYFRTPLWWAAQNGCEGVVRMLLDREGVDPDQADSEYGRTPLSLAAEQGHEEVVRMLLDQKSVNPNQIDGKQGRTPLLWAAQMAHERVVGVLLDREGIDPNQVDSEYGRTPLLWAAQMGHEGVVTTFLDREGADPDRAGSECGQTPLIAAVLSGHEGVVRVLLDQDGVNPNQVDGKYGRTPLFWAAISGNWRVVKMLLERKYVRPHIQYTKNPNNTQLTLSTVANQHLVIASFVCILAFLVYLFPSLPQTNSSKRETNMLRKSLVGEE